MPQLVRSEVRYVDVPGAQLGYEVVGEGSGKQPLIMLHGYSLRSTGPLYTSLYEHLAEAFTIYTLDTRGHGASAHLVEGWTFDQMATDIAVAVANLGLSRPIHAGHSYGGFMGLLTELHYPGTFSALCLLAPAAASGGGATPGDVTSIFPTHGRDRTAMRDLLGGMYVNQPTAEHLDHVVDAVTIMDLQVHELYFNQEYPRINIMDRLGQITLPVLSVTGGRDFVVSPDQQRATAALLPHAKEVFFSDAGHMLPLESPERVAREIVRFVVDVNATPGAA